MDPIYETAFQPPAPTILGRRLLPFSLGHSVLLESGGSPFVDPAPKRKPNAGDLAAAVWICSQPAGKLRFVLAEPDPKGITQWGMKQRRRGIPIKAETERFVEYLNASLRMPQAWHDEKDARKIVTAWQFSVVAALLESGIQRAEAWDMPVAEALALYMAIQERRGLDLVSPEDRAMIDALDDPQEDAP